jgi:hypothetical protein
MQKSVLIETLTFVVMCALCIVQCEVQVGMQDAGRTCLSASVLRGGLLLPGRACYRTGELRAASRTSHGQRTAKRAGCRRALVLWVWAVGQASCGVDERRGAGYGAGELQAGRGMHCEAGELVS